MADLTEFQKRDRDALIDIGRNYAVEIIKDCLSTSQTQEEMSRQIFMIRIAAVHILATEMFNEKRQLGASTLDVFNRLVIDMKFELQYIENGEAIGSIGPPAPVYPIRS